VIATFSRPGVKKHFKDGFVPRIDSGTEVAVVRIGAILKEKFSNFKVARPYRVIQCVLFRPVLVDVCTIIQVRFNGLYITSTGGLLQRNVWPSGFVWAVSHAR